MPFIKPNVLVAPLDWGLGHASRCIPIIHHLLDIGCNVIVACEGAQKQLLRLEFPGLEIIDLRGYRIDYTRSKRWFATKILLQVPKILRTITHEHKELLSLVEKHNINAIISDNRFGLWHTTIPTVFITHQLHIKGPAAVERLIRKLNYSFIKRFSACWVPDVNGLPNLAGALSHPHVLPPVSTKYIGGLSRFSQVGNPVKKYDLLIVISGPEPQRTQLEKKLLADLQQYDGKVLFVRGLPGSSETIESFKHVSFVNHLGAADLNAAFLQSDCIISRSGYTTVMDIIKLGKKSILIPTPGQTEQEYLGIHLQQQKWCLTFAQDEFDLATALQQFARFEYDLPSLNMEAYKPIITQFIGSLKSVHA